MPMIRFFSSLPGRTVRALLGVAMMMLGIRIDGAAGIALIFAGLLPIALAVFNVCLLAPLFGAPVRRA
jgi:hypothetical protein